MQTFVRELRGLPAWLLREYLVDLGGCEALDGWIRGAGWQAHLAQIDDYIIGSLRVGQVRLEWQGDAAAAETVWPLLEKKLLRAGG